MRRRWMTVFLATAFACGERGPATHAQVQAPQVPAPEAATAPRVVRTGDSVEGSPVAPSTPVAPDPPTAGHLYGADRLAHLFGALGALDDRRAHDDVRILQYGDSHTASDTSTGVYRRLLQARFGAGGRGFVAIGMPWATYTQDGVHGGMTKEFEVERPHLEAGRYSPDGCCYGLLGVAVGATDPGARAWAEVTAPSSRIEVGYWQRPAGGSFDVLVDGARAGRIATRAAVAADGFSAFDLPEAPHRVELRTVGDGAVRVFGMTLDRAEAGVVVDSLGINGAQIYTVLHWSEDDFVQQLRRRAPDLVVLAYGTNEALDPRLELPSYERALVELLGRVARAAPASSCLLFGPPDLARPAADGRDVWSTWPRLAEIAAVQRRVALATGCAFYDQTEAMGGPGSIAAWAVLAEPLAARDRVHLTRGGYAQVATSFTADLLRAYDRWRNAGGRPEVSAR